MGLKVGDDLLAVVRAKDWDGSPASISMALDKEEIDSWVSGGDSGNYAVVVFQLIATTASLVFKNEFTEKEKLLFDPTVIIEYNKKTLEARFTLSTQKMLKKYKRENKKANIPVYEICDACGAQTSTIKRCSGCKNVRYCNSVCQRSDWKNHKSDCCK